MTSPTNPSSTSSNWTPFNNDKNVIKSTWNHSPLIRKQMRIRIETSGTLSIQVVVQNVFALLISSLLKFLSCGKIKSFGKKVVSFSQSHTIPSELKVPLSQKKEQKILEMQKKYRLSEPFNPLKNEVETPNEPPSNADDGENKILEPLPQVVDNTKPAVHSTDEETAPFNNDTQTNNPSAIPSSPLSLQQCYSNFLTKIQDHILDLKTRSQFTSAMWLERETQKTLSFLDLKGDNEQNLKIAMEALEDAFDSTEQNVSFVTQLAELPEGSSHEKKLKTLVIQEIQEYITCFKNELDDKEKKFIQLFPNFYINPKKENLRQIWMDPIHDFFAKTSSKAESLAKFSDSEFLNASEFWIINLLCSCFKNSGLEPTLERLESLDRRTLLKHDKCLRNFCKKSLAFIENETQIENIIHSQALYEAALAKAQSKSLELIQEGEFLSFARLETIQRTHATILEKAQSSLLHANRALHYAQALKTAHTTITDLINEIEKTDKIDAIQQLVQLKHLSSPSYDTLHQLLIENGKAELNAYIATLNKYQALLNAAIPIFSEQKYENLQQMHDINSKITLKIVEATSLTIDYAVKSRVWSLFKSPAALNTLSPTQLDSYLKHIAKIAETGIAEITKDSAEAGFSFN